MFNELFPLFWLTNSKHIRYPLNCYRLWTIHFSSALKCELKIMQYWKIACSVPVLEFTDSITLLYSLTDFHITNVIHESLIELEGVLYVDPITHHAYNEFYISYFSSLTEVGWREECKIWGPQLPEYDSILYGKYLPMFQNSLLPTSSAQS
jgi:hypothetical protein